MPENREDTMYKHILVPVDLSDTGAAQKAIAVAKHIARRDGSRMTMITVVPAWPEDLASAPRDYEPEFEAFVAEQSDGFDIEGEVKIGGSISGRIIEAVETRKIDLVVMASHDPRITDYLIGSNSAHVVLHAPCSVLVVR
jgi:nucleotide-binding universal stress UspA family protein